MKLKTLNEIVVILEKFRKNSKKIVFTNGCFDIIHSGHIQYLTEAKALGDILIIGLNSDCS
ncbi:MAG: adenylyltransferase/cytidyltransferase family protein, partial [Candidatus Cloacimonetes bacterium]|nr:adenylyltransferase/cytidyltransferase family protein [Candidatus Cloacimonadota bacterium]